MRMPIIKLITMAMLWNATMNTTTTMSITVPNMSKMPKCGPNEEGDGNVKMKKIMTLTMLLMIK
jgi:hypothetical protein